jgi:uncharacterized membrane protein
MMGIGHDVGVTETRSQGNPVGTALGRQARPKSSTTGPYQRLADEDRGTGGESLANFLGWFSVALGLAQVAAPGGISRLVGIEDDDRNRALMRTMGLRELTSGLGILSKQQPAGWVWARVAGDALDLALLGRAMSDEENHRGRTVAATLAVLGVTMLDIMCAKQLSAQPETEANQGSEDGVIRTKRSVTVGRPVEEVYAFWRDFEKLPQFMRHLESVRVTGPRTSHWKAKAPAGKTVEWDAETIEDRPNELISWRSVEGSDVYNAGTVRFTKAPKGMGTEVRVEMEYDPPFGKLGSKVAMLWREEPGQQVQDDLRHFKQVMEIGEIVVSDASVKRGPHPGQPHTEPVHAGKED